MSYNEYHINTSLLFFLNYILSDKEDPLMSSLIIYISFGL